MINGICNTWIGKLRLYANVARFGRNNKVAGSNCVKKTNVVTSSVASIPRGTGGVSYANMVNGFVPEKEMVDKINEDSPAVILDLDGRIETEFPLALVGCVNEFGVIPNLRCLCRNEGFLEVELKYIGGLWVMMNFGSTDARDKFLAHEGVSSWFKELKPWTKEFKVLERLIWIDVEGVPIKA